MIGFLQGIIVVRDDPHLIIDVGGIGYRVTVPKNILAKGAGNGQKLKVFTYTHVRDDAIELFGFEAPEDLKLFKHLISVSGVGPKTAMNIFSVGGRSEIMGAIAKADVDFFISVPRLGRKNAQKIIIELKNKFGSTAELDLTDVDMSGNEEAVVALKNFGFTSKEIHDAIRAVKKEGQKITETIKLALKYLGK